MKYFLVEAICVLHLCVKVCDFILILICECCGYSDSDSGLGRATPPRRAPSPGMISGSSSGRHLPSPSGPGSLPHPSSMSRRRIAGSYDDGASDISSTPSSIFGDYSGKNCLSFELLFCFLFRPFDPV